MRSPSAKIIAFRPGLQVVGETIRDLAKDYPEWVLRTVEDARYGELIAAIHPASNTMLAAHWTPSAWRVISESGKSLAQSSSLRRAFRVAIDAAIATIQTAADEQT
jgi:hypothetical protein